MSWQCTAFKVSWVKSSNMLDHVLVRVIKNNYIIMNELNN